MSSDRADRYAEVLVARSKLVLVVVFLLTAVVGTGAVVTETEDAGIGEFETDSEEQAALEYVEAAYEEDDREITQIVVREDGGDVLTRESLLDGLALQQDIRANESVNATVDEMVGLEAVVGTAAYTEDRVAAFEERGEELGERQADLEDRRDALETGLDESRELQRAFEELNATANETDPTYQEASDDLEAEFDAVVEDAVTAAELDDEAASEYEEIAREGRGLESALVGIEQATDDPEATPGYQEVETALEGIYAAGTVGLLEDEFDALEEDFDALEADREEFADDDGPTIEEQREALETRSGNEVETLVADVLEGDLAGPDDGSGNGESSPTATPGAGGDDVTAFVSDDYDPDETTAESRVTFVFHEVPDGASGSDGADGGAEAGDEADADQADADDDDDGVPEPIAAAQLEIDSLFEERFGGGSGDGSGNGGGDSANGDGGDTDDGGFVFGQAITDEITSNAVGDSFAIITPVALVLVLGILGITYRDVVDVLVGLVGIGVVMVWLAGLLGWLEIPTSQLLIAVPFLLIGLSIDYALHVVMRYREARAGTLGIGGDPGDESAADSTDGAAADSNGESASAEAGVARGVRTGMVLGLGGVVLALAAATFSTGIGFLSNVVSPLPAIQDFAVLSAGGIFATFVAFGVLVPALKVEVDGLLEKRFDRDRAKPAFGVTPGPINSILGGGVALARRAPFVVVFVALLLAVGGAYGATGIDTEFNEADFLPEDAPEWASYLPGPLEPDTYTISDDVTYLGDNFQDPDSQAQILIRGDVTDPALLAAIEDARAEATTGENTTIDARADGTAAVDGPLTVIEDVAETNETVADGLAQRDTTGDGVPDEDLEGLYDLLYEADDEAATSILERTDEGTYDSARLVVSVRGDAPAQTVAEDVRGIAGEVETGTTDGDEPAVTAVATGGPVTTAVVQDALLETLVQAFAVTLVVIGAFLTILYWVRHRALSLGLVTLAPVVAALAWLLGTMAVLDVPFNSETAVITSLAIGLGVDYSIHLGERYVVERDRHGTVTDALEATITGTGGALLGSAATTAAGFGVLALALAPPLQRFGLVTGLSIIFAFVACVTVLPSLLVLRERVLERVGS
ncbi:MMPL family transporter [Natrarchaeobaculum aegyptiacum]|uniref:RND transporter n=1 Tax=Natrarchaeobaculum aegyptiacum TaxID=745377 RepID=A0A2Z2HT48_9EURY|nr:MMPL family transporter [Natrarchaeobaculum aegyptiacum]ARS90370.1 RND transporter [Natrarchaeobaculum aegyptiacum]